MAPLTDLPSDSAGSVLLDSPVHPVPRGQDVTLACRCSHRNSGCGANTTFHKDEGVVKGSADGLLRLLNVSPSDEGLYACQVNGAGQSPWSWLAVRGDGGRLLHEDKRGSALPPADQEPPTPPPLLLLLLLRHLLVGTPLLLSTVLLGLIYRDRGEEGGGGGRSKQGEGGGRGERKGGEKRGKRIGEKGKGGGERRGGQGRGRTLRTSDGPLRTSDGL